MRSEIGRKEGEGEKEREYGEENSHSRHLVNNLNSAQSSSETI